MANKYHVVATPGRFAGYVCARRTLFVEADDDKSALAKGGAILFQEMLSHGRTVELAMRELGELDWYSVYTN